MHCTLQHRWRQQAFDRRCRSGPQHRRASGRRSRRWVVHFPQGWGTAACKRCGLDLAFPSQASKVVQARPWCCGTEDWASSHALLPCSVPSIPPDLPGKKMMRIQWNINQINVPLSEKYASSPALQNSSHHHLIGPSLASLSYVMGDSAMEKTYLIIKCKR